MSESKPLRGQTKVSAAIDVAAFTTSKSPVRANDTQIGGSHYSGGNYQHWDLSTDLRLRHLEGAATKYMSRFGNKAGESAFKDLSKTRHYVVKLIEVYNEGRISTQASNLVSNCVDQETINDSLDRFLASLSGPPARHASHIAIIKLCTWKGREDLQRALEMIDELITEYREVEPVKDTDLAQTKERTE